MHQQTDTDDLTEDCCDFYLGIPPDFRRRPSNVQVVAYNPFKYIPLASHQIARADRKVCTPKGIPKGCKLIWEQTSAQRWDFRNSKVKAHERTYISKGTMTVTLNGEAKKIDSVQSVRKANKKRTDSSTNTTNRKKKFKKELSY